MRLKMVGRLGAAAALWLCLATAALADQLLDQAKKFLQEQNPKAAFELLLPWQPRRAGEIEYDYLLGIAALDAGDAQQAVFALERVLAVNPGYLQARAEIARAYFVLGERENARREFTAVKRQGVPEAARATIDRYLSALEPQRTELRGYLEATVGWDSNVNSATARSTVAIPAFGGAVAQLNALGIRESDSFAGFGAGLSVSHPLSSEWSLLAAGAYNGKFNRDADMFNTGQLDGSAGVRWADGTNQIVAIGQAQRFWIDDDTYRDSAGGTAQWLHSFTPSQQMTVFGQFAALRYPAQAPRDADRVIGGVGYSQAFAIRYSPVFFASAYGGEERERDRAFPWLGHKPLGLRGGGQLSLADRSLAFASISFEHRRYNGSDPLFLVRREDNQLEYRLGLSFVPAHGWTLTAQITYTDNHSNIDLNDFRRGVTSLSLRRDF